jgi:hypothetical protein
MTTSAKLAADLVLIELAYEAIDLEHIERLLAERRETR